VVGLLKDADASVRHAVTMSLSTGVPPKRHEDVCKVWADNLGNADPAVARSAINETGTEDCRAQYELLLDFVTPLVKKGGVEYVGVGAAVLEILRERGQSTAPQRKRAYALARSIAENPANEGVARGAMLEELQAYDKPGTKALLTKLTKDKDENLSDKAKALLAGKTE
jgi:hypothetical protein